MTTTTSPRRLCAYLFVGLFGASLFFNVGQIVNGQTLPSPLDGLSPEAADIMSHISVVFLDDGEGGLAKTIRFTGVNVQIVNGLEATNGYPQDQTSVDPELTQTNGVGNLIVGYNELALEGRDDNRTGSHNVVVGTEHNYASFGGTVVAYRNEITGAYATITGGRSGHAHGQYTSISGGDNNLAEGDTASISGGRRNRVGDFCVVVGGEDNRALGVSSVVSGGDSNTTNGMSCWVGGGQSNEAFGSLSIISGGFSNLTTGFASSIVGGQSNEASMSLASIAGGAFNPTFRGSRSRFLRVFVRSFMPRSVLSTP